MAAVTGIGRIVVIPVVTNGTIVCNRRMCTVQRIIIVVNRESSRRPPRSGRMAHGTIRRDIQIQVFGIGGLVKIRRVTSRALCGRTCVSVRMTLNTVSRQMRTR